eukprot:CAMPEP_0198207558 /NCGR_PEP_ID=MMETSP1445-20131203/10995_1 /TAXON_ID=36898 /ORGANISM="Pyramimonas sp., Strain CCMP2087" /LENGTH=132 /DNA_ID=CAMNT_0043880635 /DNA_START=107 /DNA_END=505 /DNA_ORIENTATION=+
MVLRYQNSHLHPEEDDYRELVYTTPTTASQKKLKILEVCCTSLANIEARKAEKTSDKYAPLLERLIAAGYTPELYVVALGTSGEITTATTKTLGKFGMKDAPLDNLIQALHKNTMVGRLHRHGAGAQQDSSP